MMSRTTINDIEMADLLIILARVRDGGRLKPAEQHRAGELRDSIIAGTPEDMRVGR